MRSIFVFSLLLLLVACGGGSKQSEQMVDELIGHELEDDDDGYDIYSLSSALVLDDRVVVDPAVDGGSLELKWSDKQEQYTVEIALSSDNFFDSKDITIIDIACGGMYSSCDEQGSSSCRFNSENILSCNRGAVSSTGVDITSMLDVLPKNLYLIANICDADYESCEYYPLPVEFR